MYNVENKSAEEKMMVKENKHFERAKKTISRWPKWKQQIGRPPLSNRRK